MSSLLTFQLIQQQEQQKKESSCLPSPPSSFCGEDSSAAIHEPPQLQCRRDSLQTVFNDMTLKDYSTSLPENYTIDHSTQKHLAATPKPANRKISSSFNPSFLHTPSATATAAATGGLTIRNNSSNNNMSIHSNHNRSRQPESIQNGRRKSRGLSESLHGQYRCHDCGKSYKHPNCLQKHRWEHSEEWEITKKLPLTKHQQVQMLEAAAILVGINKSLCTKEEEEEDEDIEIEDSDEESIVIDDEGHLSSIDSSGIFLDDL